MNIRKILLAAAAALLLAALPLLSGCGRTAEYADPITENILVSMNEQDYAGFSRDFDENMKNELPEDTFPGFLGAVNGQVGDYIAGSKDMTGVEIENGYTQVNYEADFESMDDVKVEVIFQEIDGEKKVVGLWFR